MLRKKLFPMFSLCALLSFGALVGCDKPTPPGPGPEPETEEYLVSFYVDGTLYGEQLTVEAGTKLTAPTDPTREMDDDYIYTFDGWYEAGSSTAWDFETGTVNKNLDLFAEFSEELRQYDLIVYALGGSSSTVYITEDEINRVKSTFTAVHADKDVLVKFFPASTNDAFNAKALSTKNKPDVILSGSKMDSGANPLTLNESYPKTKVAEGWFTSLTRYVGVNETCTDNLELAVDFYTMLTTEGPDVFTLETNAVTLKETQTKTVGVTLKEGDTRTVAWTSADTSIATVENGVITGVKAGTTKVTATLGLVSVEIEVEVIENVVYDLVVFAQHDGGSSSVYLTDEEFALVQREFEKVASLTGKNVYWVNVKGLSVAEFNKSVNDTIAGGLVVDVVIAGGNMDSADYNPISTDAVYNKVYAGQGWFESTNRRVAITDACDANMELAILLYNMVKNAGPNYEGVELSKTSASIAVGDTLALEAVAYGNVTWTSSDNTVATVENGVVTALAAGTVTITATSLDGGEATCTITINATAVVTKYDLVVYVHMQSSATKGFLTEQDLLDIQAAFTAEGAAGYGKNIHWVTVSNVKNAPFGEAALGAAEGEECDVVIGSSGIVDDGSCNLQLQAPERVQLHSSWYNHTDKCYIGILEGAYDSHLELANALITLVTSAKA